MPPRSPNTPTRRRAPRRPRPAGQRAAAARPALHEVSCPAQSEGQRRIPCGDHTIKGDRPAVRAPPAAPVFPARGGGPWWLRPPCPKPPGRTRAVINPHPMAPPLGGIVAIALDGATEASPASLCWPPPTQGERVTSPARIGRGPRPSSWSAGPPHEARRIWSRLVRPVPGATSQTSAVAGPGDAGVIMQGRLAFHHLESRRQGPMARGVGNGTGPASGRAEPVPSVPHLRLRPGTRPRPSSGSSPRQ